MATAATAAARAAATPVTNASSTSSSIENSFHINTTLLNYLPIIVLVVISLIFALGAARLSYTYNLYIGNSTGVAFGYAVLNFFFSYFRFSWF